ncbi:ACT domain-containing protein [Pelagicoccus sp. SDUM812003]|uniref:ACT domain-containing protein n=1 Tax=Pelagicoccus sp. SDUM812003 TaxID=3041267 RepID=UPI00280D9E25|nr:ACT domain-containing protein [Pelagicoccus sp. SDUM812003]MDQ8204159.1 ACT domain-containing protein [Pelagicoccus sp. SDUM812003]
MSGISDLNTLLRTMDPVASQETFVFVSILHEAIPSTLVSCGRFKEAEGITLICEEREALKHNLSYDCQYRRITLNVHSSLQAVGFLAAISHALAAAEIPCNVVSAFYHDHLFIPVPQAEQALQVLRSFA